MKSFDSGGYEKRKSKCTIKSKRYCEGGDFMLQEELLKKIDDNQKIKISNRITASREAAQITSQEMADFIGIGYEAYRRIERGTVLVKTEHINALVQALGVTADYILYGDTSQMKHESISAILKGLNKDELERAEKILLAAFR